MPLGYGVSPRRDQRAFNNLADTGALLTWGTGLSGIGPLLLKGYVSLTSEVHPSGILRIAACRAKSDYEPPGRRWVLTAGVMAPGGSSFLNWVVRETCVRPRPMAR
jgi:hypothetical protein